MSRPRHAHSPASSEQGFSLIELIVVLVVVAILLATAAYVLHSTKRTGGLTLAVATARTYASAADEYANDHQGRVPKNGPGTDWPAPVEEGPVDPRARGGKLGTAMTPGHYIHQIPASITDGRLTLGFGTTAPSPLGSAGGIAYNGTGSDYEISVFDNKGVRLCSMGTKISGPEPECTTKLA